MYDPKRKNSNSILDPFVDHFYSLNESQVTGNARVVILHIAQIDLSDLRLLSLLVV